MLRESGFEIATGHDAPSVSIDELAEIEPGDAVMVVGADTGARYWLDVTAVEGNILKGKVANTLNPETAALGIGADIECHREHVRAIECIGWPIAFLTEANRAAWE